MSLLLDSDTFICGDVERVFDKYDQYDVSACRPSAILRSDLAPGGHRYVIGIPAQASAWTRVTFTPAPSPAPVVIDELGFFASQSGLLRSDVRPFPRIA